MTTLENTARYRRARDLESLPMLPAGPTQGFLRGTRESVRGVWAYRELLYLLFRRELKARYKDSVLGLVWSWIRPLAQLAVYAIAVGQFLGASKSVPDYPIYVFSGLTIWQLFAEVLAAGTGSILANGGLVKKIYLPREVFPLSAIGAALFNFVMQTCVLLAGCFILQKPPHAANVGFAFLAMGVMLTWGTALALVLGAVNVYLRDIQYIVEILLMWGMWTAPVVYSWQFVGPKLHSAALREIYVNNPITMAVMGYHRAFWATETSQDTIGNLATHMAIVLCVGLLILWLCQRVFARLEANFAQEL